MSLEMADVFQILKFWTIIQKRKKYGQNKRGHEAMRTSIVNAAHYLSRIMAPPGPSPGSYSPQMQPPSRYLGISLLQISNYHSTEKQ